MNKLEKDIAEEYGCVCCGGGYLEMGTAKWFAKISDLLDYMKSIGKKKKSEKENEPDGNN